MLCFALRSLDTKGVAGTIWERDAREERGGKECQGVKVSRRNTKMERGIGKGEKERCGIKDEKNLICGV
jgi:hypothetical protein